MNFSAQVLKWLLLLSGLFLVSAFAAMFLPRSWMASAHEFLGLGEFPDTPITYYLTRSTSLLYGVHGVLMMYVAITIEHHWRLVSVFGWLHIAIGFSMLVIDWMAPMPVYWIAGEGLPVATLGLAILIIAKRANFSDLQSALDSRETSDEAAAV